MTSRTVRVDAEALDDLIAEVEITADSLLTGDLETVARKLREAVSKVRQSESESEMIGVGLAD